MAFGANTHSALAMGPASTKIAGAVRAISLLRSFGKQNRNLSYKHVAPLGRCRKHLPLHFELESTLKNFWRFLTRWHRFLPATGIELTVRKMQPVYSFQFVKN